MYRRRQTGGKRIKGDFTCGLDLNKKPFSMKKCLDMKQVRYWGKKKIDSRLLEKGADPNAAKKEKRKELISKQIILKNQIKKLADEKKYFGHRRTKAQINEINEKGQKLVDKLKLVQKQIDKF